MFPTVGNAIPGLQWRRPVADLKQEMSKRVPVRTKAKLRDAANDHMAMLEQNPERVMSYFQDRHVRYAAQDFTGQDQ